MSYFFVTTLQAFFCIALLSAVLWARGAPPVLRPLVWTLLTALGCGNGSSLSAQPGTGRWTRTWAD